MSDPARENEMSDLVDTLTRERDEARASLARVTAELAQSDRNVREWRAECARLREEGERRFNDGVEVAAKVCDENHCPARAAEIRALRRAPARPTDGSPVSALVCSGCGLQLRATRFSVMFDGRTLCSACAPTPGDAAPTVSGTFDRQAARYMGIHSSTPPEDAAPRCEACGGSGERFMSRFNGDSDPPARKCSECGGSGRASHEGGGKP